MFQTEDMYFLLPTIYSSKSIDTADLRYLNSDFVPLRHPFFKSFDIEAYNACWFHSDPAIPINMSSSHPVSQPILSPQSTTTPTVYIAPPSALPRMVDITKEPYV